MVGQIDRIQGLVGNLGMKAPCRVATTANITLSGLQTIDGVALAEKDRALVKNQLIASENGVYDVSAGAWTRAADFDGIRDVVTGTTIPVGAEGAENAKTYWFVTTTGSIIPGTSALTFSAAMSAGAAIHDAITKAAPVDADEFGYWDSVTGLTRKFTFANMKAAIFGAWGALTAAATAKATPVDGDMVTLADSAATNATKSLTWGDIKATMFGAWGALINAATAKTTPADADAIAIMDSAAANATKKLTWANSKATLKAYFDPIYAAIAGSASQVFSVGAAASAAHALRLDQDQVPFRNRLINGDFAVSQVNGSSAVTVTAAAALNYVIDQWYAYCTGANVTGQRVAGAAATGDGAGSEQYRYQFTGAASVTKIGFAQRIEQLNSYDMASSTAIVGVNMANSLLTTVTWTAWYANTADTFGSLASPTRTQIGTGTITVSSAYTRYYIPITMPAGATTGIEIEFSVGAQISGTWHIGRVQWEKVASGAVTGTAFEVVGYDDQLRRARRYLPVIAVAGSNEELLSGVCYSTTDLYAPVFFKNATRVPVTGVSLSAGYAASTLVTGATRTVTGITLSSGGTNGARLIVTHGGGALVAGQAAISALTTGSISFTGAQL